MLGVSKMPSGWEPVSHRALFPKHPVIELRLAEDSRQFARLQAHAMQNQTHCSSARTGYVFVCAQSANNTHRVRN